MSDDKIGDAYSVPHIAPLYPRGPYEYHDASALVVLYSIDASLAEELVPAPLETGDSPTCSVWFFEYPRVSGLGSYNELVVGIGVTHDGAPLTYVVYEGLDSEVPVCAGREIHGTGKKYGEVDLETHGNVRTGRYRRTGVDVATATVECQSFVDRHPMTHDEARMAYWKRIPSAEKGAPPAIDRITVSLTRDINVEWAMAGPASVSFTEAAADPLHRFAPEDDDDVSGFFLQTDFVLDNAEGAVLHTFDEYRP